MKIAPAEDLWALLLVNSEFFIENLLVFSMFIAPPEPFLAWLFRNCVFSSKMESISLICNAPPWFSASFWSK